MWSGSNKDDRSLQCSRNNHDDSFIWQKLVSNTPNSKDYDEENSFSNWLIKCIRPCRPHVYLYEIRLRAWANARIIREKLCIVKE